MIRSFADSRTEALARGQFTRGIPSDVLRRAVNKLFLLDTATRLEDLRVPPGNRLEALSATRAGQHSIRVNDQWRICLTWTSDGVHDVALVDCHQDGPMARDIAMPHPGTILREEFLDPMGLSIQVLAKAIHVPRSRIDEVCQGRRGMSANIASRLGRYFGVDPRWFLNKQSKHDLHVQGEALAHELSSIATRQTG